MSAAREYLAALERHGVKIVPNGDGLRLVPPAGKTVPSDIIERGRALKPALLAFLRGQTEDDIADAFEERAAICEYDGGLQRAEAELLSAACVIPLATGETMEVRQATILHFAEHLDRLRKRRSAPSVSNGGSAA